MGRLRIDNEKPDQYRILKTYTGLSELLERGKKLGKRIKNPEYRFDEERHNDIVGYEKVIINGESSAAGLGMVGFTGTES